MDSIVSLLTTTEGRIGRKQWWIGVIVLAVVAIVVSLLLGAVSFGNAAFLAWAAVALNLALIWPSYCIGIKRRHDRDNDGTDLKVLIAVSVVFNVIQALGVGVTPTDIGNGLIVPVPDLWLTVLNLIFAVFAIYMLVQLGFLKGTTGANRYGPDPLDAAA